MKTRTSIQSLPITDRRGRNMLVDAMWQYPVGGLMNEAKDNPFYFSVTRVVYVMKNRMKDVTGFITKPGFKELENEAVEQLVKEGIIYVYRKKNNE